MQGIIDWIKTLEDYSTWYQKDNASLMAFIKVKTKSPVNISWRMRGRKQFADGSTATTRTKWTDVHELVEKEAFVSDYEDQLCQ